MTHEKHMNKDVINRLSWEEVMLLDQETLFPCGVMRTPGFGSNSSNYTECKRYLGAVKNEKTSACTLHTKRLLFCCTTICHRYSLSRMGQIYNNTIFICTSPVHFWGVGCKFEVYVIELNWPELEKTGLNQPKAVLIVTLQPSIAISSCVNLRATCNWKRSSKSYIVICQSNRAITNAFDTYGICAYMYICIYFNINVNLNIYIYINRQHIKDPCMIVDSWCNCNETVHANIQTTI